MSEWRPIETAPKNGTEVVVFGEWAGEINGTGDGMGSYVAKWVNWTDYPGFKWVISGTDAYSAWCRATHWMPLPEPPKGGDAT